MKTKLNELIDLDGYETCGLPYLLHKGPSCTRSSKVDSQVIVKVWKDYQEKIKPIGVSMKREKFKEKEMTAWTKSEEALAVDMKASNASRDPGLEKLVEMLEKK